MGSLTTTLLVANVPIAKMVDPMAPQAKTPEVAVENPKTQAGLEAEYKIVEEPSRLNRKLRICCVGAGASAINFAHEVQQSKLDLDLVCYDKNPSVGGTWYENKYPGCGCDIPSVNYQLSWAPSPHWSSL
jgi:hypothetical protein